METQQRHKVNRRQAVGILKGKGKRTAMEPMRYERYVLVSVQQKQIRKVCPFQVEAFLIDQFNLKRAHNLRETRVYNQNNIGRSIQQVNEAHQNIRGDMHNIRQ